MQGVTSTRPGRRVVFIEPRSPGSHIFSIYPLPRLGSVILGTMLHRSGYDVSIHVEEIQPINLHAMQSADIIGITTTTSTAPRAYAYADLARSMNKRVVLGGPHVTFRPHEALLHADCVVMGEAEEVVLELFHRLSGGEPVSDLPGVVTAESLQLEGNPLAPKPLDLDTLPVPDLNLIDGFNVKKRVFRKMVVPIQATRGCPYDCAFCSVTGMFGRRFRFRSVDSVMEELVHHNRKPVQFFFYDDNLAANPGWFAELLERMSREKQTFRWSAQVRVEVARDRELLVLMKRAGCTALFVGVESFNAATLEAMNKQQTPDEIAEAMKRFRQHRLNVHGMFVLGMDTDTPESIRTTVRWAKQARFSSVQFLILTPLPGTRTYRQLVEENRLLFDDWSLYDAHHVTFQPAQMSPAELQSLQLEAHDTFYSRTRTLRRLAAFRAEAAGIFVYARRLQREWRKANNVFQDLLKLMERSGGMIKKVQYMHPAGCSLFGHELPSAGS